LFKDATMIAPAAATRLTRECRQTLHASHERVFPLLCPEREKEWLPGWEARWIHSVSGFAEPRAVFATHHDKGAEIIWVVAEHRPASRVHFVRWHLGTMVVDIELDLSSPQPATTWLDIRYTYTATSPQGDAAIEAMTLETWHAQMHAWEDHLDAWLQTPPR
jgi:hypothetical protein